MKRVKIYYIIAIVLIWVVSCKKDNQSEQEIVPTPTTPSGSFFKADFNGVTKTFSSANSYVNFYGLEIFLPDTNGNIDVSPKAGLASSVPDLISIQFVNNIYDSATYSAHADSLFHAVMHTGSYLYANGPGITGVNIYYANGSYCWGSSYQSQTGSMFSITSSSYLPDILTHSYHEIEFTFNCKLYDCANTGNTIVIQNGSGRLKFEGQK